MLWSQQTMTECACKVAADWQRSATGSVPAGSWRFSRRMFLDLGNARSWSSGFARDPVDGRRWPAAGGMIPGNPATPRGRERAAPPSVLSQLIWATSFFPRTSRRRQQLRLFPFIPHTLQQGKTQWRPRIQTSASPSSGRTSPRCSTRRSSRRSSTRGSTPRSTGVRLHALDPGPPTLSRLTLSRRY
jgi:hypothetical protein